MIFDIFIVITLHSNFYNVPIMFVGFVHAVIKFVHALLLSYVVITSSDISCIYV